MAEIENKVSYETDEVGMLMHTALRKIADSEPTSYAWNVIHLLNETWKAFCDAVAGAQVQTGTELKAVFESQEKWWPDSLNPGVRTQESFYARQIFRLALDQFDDRDWEDMAAYLNEES